MCIAIAMALLGSSFALAQSRDELRAEPRPTATERYGDRASDLKAADKEMARFMQGMPDEFREIFDPEGKLAAQAPADVRLERIGDRTRLPENIRPFIVDVTFDGATPTVFFEVADENGNGVADVESMNVGVSVVKLMPGDNGRTPYWKAYIYGSDEGLPQAGSSNRGELTNLGGGNYSFTLDSPLDSFADIPFEDDLTHRIGIDLRNVTIMGQQLSNQLSGDSWFDVQPSTGATEDIPTRRIAAQENCAS
ncbi:MAG: hypothetical protein EA419_04360, partial [Wenzhouxiangella sp.]